MSPAKKVSLTFDDGPNPPFTNQILEILKKEKIKATFFVCGANIKKHPETLKKIAKEDHLIGNHTYNHRYIETRLGLNYKEILETQKLIENQTQQKIRLFRAPWTFAPPWLTKKLKKGKFRIVPWDILGDYHDYSGRAIPSAEGIVQRVMRKVKNNSIILLHDGHNTQECADRSKTVKALPQIIDKLKKLGFEFTSSLDLIN